MKLTVAEIEPSQYGQWDNAVRQSRAGSPYSTSTYLGAMSEVTGRQHALVGVLDGGRIVGGIGILFGRRNDRSVIRGRYLLYYNGPFVRGISGAGAAGEETNTRRILTALESWLSTKSGANEIQIKARHPLRDVRCFLATGWRVKPVYSYEVDVADRARCRECMHRNLRRQLRQAERANLRVTTSNDIDTFFDMHEMTALRKGFPCYLSRQGMARWFARLSQAEIASLFLCADQNGQTVAGALVLAGGHDVAHLVAAASVSETVPPGTSTLLRWRIFETLGERGFSAVDLTDAHEPRVARYKSQLGGRLVLSLELTQPATISDHLTFARRRLVHGARRHIKRIVRRGVEQ